MKTKKAGCILLNVELKSIGLVYREQYNDFSFPKGHVEEGEDIITAAIRETEEETKRKVKILDKYEPYVEEYKTPRGEDCICYMYIGLDNGVSDNDSLDTHPFYWIKIEDVKNKLSYQSLKDMWDKVKNNVLQEMKNKNKGENYEK